MYGIFEFYMFVLFIISVSCLFYCCRNAIKKVKRDSEGEERKKQQEEYRKKIKNYKFDI